MTPATHPLFDINFCLIVQIYNAQAVPAVRPQRHPPLSYPSGPNNHPISAPRRLCADIDKMRRKNPPGVLPETNCLRYYAKGISLWNYFVSCSASFALAIRPCIWITEDQPFDSLSYAALAAGWYMPPCFSASFPASIPF